ncbi:serine dehydratase subunit alpha family protein [Desulfobaculum bizertense]|uniref:UPF0597 protein SAMN02745702_02817 n=1 Tax=Desulfobaculum bizertense DSM 18034 TaxID=1121442 RepID=A0A1T4WZ02_9BACT|nr:L-serine ammonia-lyase, iron-sulfur-dependent, subunit alpha [Desulfobaculum bizertense]SKA82580.1 L-cysteine desulfidase [Desulfobaculum bizertense DSM 18034]
MTSEWTQFIELLHREVVPALGCTEPIAIALAAAKAAETLGATPESIEANISGNLLKNGMGVGVPGTGQRGLDIAAAVGALGGKSEAMLEVLKDLSPQHVEQANAMLKAGKVHIDVANTDALLYCEIIVKNGDDTARVVLQDEHTGIVHVEKNGQVLEHVDTHREDAGHQAEWPLSMKKIVEFAETAPFSEISFILEAARMNEAVAKEGLLGDYGLQVGKTIEKNIKKHILGDDLLNEAVKLTSAAADARMHGVQMPVMSNSGSGNQGLTCTMPVVACAHRLKVSEERLTRALILSHLTSIHIKHNLGRLSALCGATVAGTASACGIVYLLGGSFDQVVMTINNMVGSIAGMICDGAKNGCALKVASAVDSGLRAAMLALEGHTITGREGIVSDDIEQTIQNLGRLGAEGMRETDRVILDTMVSKKNAKPAPERTPELGTEEFVH